MDIFILEISINNKEVLNRTIYKFIILHGSQKQHKMVTIEEKGNKKTNN
jgi:hypothetical protein